MPLPTFFRRPRSAANLRPVSVPDPATTSPATPKRRRSRYSLSDIFFNRDRNEFEAPVSAADASSLDDADDGYASASEFDVNDQPVAPTASPPEYALFPNVPEPNRLPVWSEAQDRLPPYPPARRSADLGRRSEFGSPTDATCMIRIPEAGDFWVQRASLSPFSSLFRDLLNPDHNPRQHTVRIRAGPEVLYWVADTGSQESLVLAESPSLDFADAVDDQDDDHDTAATVQIPLPAELPEMYPRRRSLSVRWTPSFLVQKSTTAKAHPRSESPSSLRKTTTKSEFFAHLAHYKSQSPPPLFRSPAALFRRRSKNLQPKPILYIHAPHPHMCEPLLRWMHEGDDAELFAAMNCARGGHHAAFFGMLGNIAEWKISDAVYEALAEYLVQHPDLPVSDQFTKLNVPVQLLRTFLARCCWSETDKLAILLWWARFEETETSSTPNSSPSSSTTSLLAQLRNGAASASKTSFHTQQAPDNQDGPTATLTLPANAPETEVQLLMLYVDILGIDSREREELRRMLPDAFDRLITGGIRLLTPRADSNHPYRR
ncbi:hypothetical protein HDU87_002739 [Geranomyces variabilis]|uniref:BTB domain-containing protein n=1 Tax=Geranomyces variabilis TaxID=109894 RepID=A0AAD5TUN7_9FUNG|nr:hypothetical protein HDU87_002739 [Geranomyces variabilis]